jgi:hypothetical protein
MFDRARWWCRCECKLESRNLVYLYTVGRNIANTLFTDDDDNEPKLIAAANMGPGDSKRLLRSFFYYHLFFLFELGDPFQSNCTQCDMTADLCTPTADLT